MTGDEMLTVAAVAERLCVSTRTVFRWIETGQLKALKIGRVLRISREDLLCFIDRQSER